MLSPDKRAAYMRQIESAIQGLLEQDVKMLTWSSLPTEQAMIGVLALNLYFWNNFIYKSYLCIIFKSKNYPLRN